jgi:galactose-1-phosphate uridylyltransferase
MAMSELRYDLLDDRWTLYAPERAARPHDVPLAFVRAPPPAFDPLCPFCPGNEIGSPAFSSSTRAGVRGTTGPRGSSRTSTRS